MDDMDFGGSDIDLDSGDSGGGFDFGGGDSFDSGLDDGGDGMLGDTAISDDTGGFDSAGLDDGGDSLPGDDAISDDIGGLDDVGNSDIGGLDAGDSEDSQADTIDNADVDNIPEDVDSENLGEGSETSPNNEIAENDDIPEDTDSDSKEDFEIGGHRNMTQEEVEQYQKDGDEAFNDSLPEDYKASEDGSEPSDEYRKIVDDNYAEQEKMMEDDEGKESVRGKLNEMDEDSGIEKEEVTDDVATDEDGGQDSNLSRGSFSSDTNSETNVNSDSEEIPSETPAETTPSSSPETIEQIEPEPETEETEPEQEEQEEEIEKQQQIDYGRGR